VQVFGDAGFLDMADIEVADKDGNPVAAFTSVAVGTTITVPESLFGGSYPSSIRITILDPASGRKSCDACREQIAKLFFHLARAAAQLFAALQIKNTIASVLIQAYA
jgi:hypothetical protein